MPDADLSPPLQSFIARYIQSVEKLEIVLLFFREPMRTRTQAEIVQLIQSSPGAINQKLDQLTAEGFVTKEPDGSYRFQPKSTTITNDVALLDEAYRHRRTKVIEAIFSRTTEELRAFSDAFKLRKETE